MTFMHLHRCKLQVSSDPRVYLHKGNRRRKTRGGLQLRWSAASSLSMLIICLPDHLIWGPAKLAIDYPIEPDHKTSPLFESGETCILLPSIDRPISSSQTRYSAMSCGASQELAGAVDLLSVGFTTCLLSPDTLFLPPQILFAGVKRRTAINYFWGQGCRFLWKASNLSVDGCGS